MVDLVMFAGSMSERKTVTIYHGSHLENPPPILADWDKVANNWYHHAPVGLYILDGEKISNFKHQWVIIDVREREVSNLG